MIPVEEDKDQESPFSPFVLQITLFGRSATPQVDSELRLFNTGAYVADLPSNNRTSPGISPVVEARFL